MCVCVERCVSHGGRTFETSGTTRWGAPGFEAFDTISYFASRRLPSICDVRSGLQLQIAAFRFAHLRCTVTRSWQHTRATAGRGSSHTMAGPPTAQAQAQAQASSDTNVDGSAPVPSLSTAASDDAILAALTGASARPGAGHRGSRKNAADGDDIDDDDDDDDGGLSDTSSRSDKSEEAAGLVSRMSDEQDRAGRRAKYEGPGRGATRAHLYSDDEDDEEDDIDVEHGAGPLFDPDAGQDQTVDDESSSISEVRDGVFRVRDGARPGSGGSGVHAPAEGQRRRERGPPNGSAATRTSASLGFRRRARPALARRVWIIAREALPTLLLSLISLVFSGELLIHLAVRGEVQASALGYLDT